jgi:hypothetical protein
MVKSFYETVKVEFQNMGWFGDYFTLTFVLVFAMKTFY